MVSAGVNFGLDLVEEIAELKRERNAVILAHNYQVPEIQDIADLRRRFVGPELQGGEDRRRRDSFLRRPFHGGDGEDRESDQDAWSCRIWTRVARSPSRARRKSSRRSSKNTRDKNYYVIAYINCSAGVKALCDVICTSGNAVKIVRARAGGSKHSFRARSKSRRLGDGADRTADGSLAGQLLRPRRVHARSIGANPARNIRTRRSSRIRNAPTRCACSPMKFARPRRWSPTAGNRRPRKSSSSPKPACCIGCERKSRTRLFIPGPTDRCACAECRFMKMNTLEKGARRAAQSRSRDHSPRAAAQTRGSADSCGCSN